MLGRAFEMMNEEAQKNLKYALDFLFCCPKEFANIQFVANYGFKKFIDKMIKDFNANQQNIDLLNVYNNVKNSFVTYETTLALQKYPGLEREELKNFVKSNGITSSLFLSSTFPYSKHVIAFYNAGFELFTYEEYRPFFYDEFFIKLIRKNKKTLDKDTFNQYCKTMQALLSVFPEYNHLFDGDGKSLGKWNQKFMQKLRYELVGI